MNFDDSLAELNYSKEQFKAILKLIPNPIYVWKQIDNDLILIEYNKAAEDITEGKIKNIIGVKASIFYEEQLNILEDLNQCIKDNIQISRELKYTFKTTGKIRVLNVSYNFVPPDMILVYTEDITEKRESEEKYRFFFENFRGIAYQGTLYFVPLFFHGAVMDITGYTDKEFITGNPRWDEIIHPEDLPKIIDEDIDTIRNHPNYMKEREYRIIQKDGKIRWLYELIQNISDENGKPYMVQGEIYDITERKKAEQLLRNSEENYREAYNRSNLYKDIFTHDISNILHTILSSAGLSKLYSNDNSKKENFNEVTNIISEQVIRGKNLVSNVQKLSEIEEDNLPKSRIEALSIINKVAEYIKESYPHKDININIDIEFIQNEYYVIANEFLENIFENVLFNAVKHNRNQSINILIRISKFRKEGFSFIKFEFLDNGVGIPDSMKHEIFLREYKKSELPSGIGLGLLLVKRIIENYEGKILVENKIQGDYTKGSNFIILIPEAI